MGPFREPSKKDWAEPFLLISFWALFLGAFTLTVVPRYPLLFIPLGIIAVLGLVTWHSRTRDYKCERCGATFKLSAFADFISPSGGDQKYVKCPACKKREWRRVLKRYKPHRRRRQSA